MFRLITGRQWPKLTRGKTVACPAELFTLHAADLAFYHYHLTFTDFTSVDGPSHLHFLPQRVSCRTFFLPSLVALGRSSGTRCDGCVPGI